MTKSISDRQSGSWNKHINLYNNAISYGFIDDGGHGDRHYMSINGKPIDMNDAELFIVVLERLMKELPDGEQTV